MCPSDSMYPDAGSIGAEHVDSLIDIETFTTVVDAVDLKTGDDMVLDVGPSEATETDDGFVYYHIRLHDNDIGATENVSYRYPEGYDEDRIVYYWTQGNGGCDCNRILEFYRNRGRTDVPRKCGNSRINLLGIWRAADGRQIVQSEV